MQSVNNLIIFPWRVALSMITLLRMKRLTLDLKERHYSVYSQWYHTSFTWWYRMQWYIIIMDKNYVCAISTKKSFHYGLWPIVHLWNINEKWLVQIFKSIVISFLTFKQFNINLFFFLSSSLHWFNTQYYTAPSMPLWTTQSHHRWKKVFVQGPQPSKPSY